MSNMMETVALCETCGVKPTTRDHECDWCRGNPSGHLDVYLDRGTRVLHVIRNRQWKPIGLLSDLVTVCSECKRACCWQGEYLCEVARGASTVDLTIQQLLELDLEHPHYWLGAAQPAGPAPDPVVEMVEEVVDRNCAAVILERLENLCRHSPLMDRTIHALIDMPKLRRRAGQRG